MVHKKRASNGRAARIEAMINAIGKRTRPVITTLMASLSYCTDRVPLLNSLLKMVLIIGSRYSGAK